MTRKKVKLAFITNDASRKATYKKRKKGLLKKVLELSTLCGIEACAIIYSPYESQPEVWPNTHAVQRVISKFKRMPEMEQSKKMMNQESFIRQRIMKATDQLKKQRENNKEKEMKEVMYQCLAGANVQNLAMEEVNHLGRVLDQNLKEISRRLEFLAKGEGLKVDEGSKDVLQVEEQKPNLNFGVEAMNMNIMNMNMNMNMNRSQWVNNQTENLNFGSGLETMFPFGDYSNATWSSAFFP